MGLDRPTLPLAHFSLQLFPYTMNPRCLMKQLTTQIQRTETLLNTHFFWPEPILFCFFQIASIFQIQRRIYKLFPPNLTVQSKSFQALDWKINKRERCYTMEWTRTQWLRLHYRTLCLQKGITILVTDEQLGWIPILCSKQNLSPTRRCYAFTVEPCPESHFKVG